MSKASMGLVGTVGNMFAICPLHHAEIHRKVVRVVKVSDCELLVEDIRLDEEAGC